MKHTIVSFWNENATLEERKKSRFCLPEYVSENKNASTMSTMKPIALPTVKRSRGNPNWGQLALVRAPALPTEFEMQVKQLRLSNNEYVSSTALKLWCQHNRNRVYVPEWLLEEWEMRVEDTFSGVARS